MGFNISSPSSTLKSVWLHKWWLVKADKGGLAVSGLVSGESKVARIFRSSAIAKRHDRTTLETTDGYLITVIDSIDRFHSLENGFPPELCNQFLFGFPDNWEDFAKCYYSVGESATEAAGPEISCLLYKNAGSFKELSPSSLDDLPATRIRDLVLSPNHVVRKRVLDVALSRHCDQDTEILATVKSKNSVTDNGIFSERTPSNKKNKTQQTSGYVGVMYESNVTETCATTTRLKMDIDVQNKAQQTSGYVGVMYGSNVTETCATTARVKMDINVPTLTSGVSRRHSIKLEGSTGKIPVNSSPYNCVLTSGKLVATRCSARLNKSTNEVKK